MAKKPLNIKGIKSVDRSFKKASKKANKQLKKATKKITKFVKQQAKTRAKAKKKKESVYDKRKKKIQKFGEKALVLNEETQRTVNQLRASGITVSNTNQLQQVKDRVENIMKKNRPREKDLELIKEYSRANTYDYIKAEFEIRTETGKDVDTSEPKEITFKQLRSILRKQVLSPDKITPEQSQIIAQYGQNVASYMSSFVTELPDEADEQQIQQFKKKFNKVRDISIGGNSTLINDLSYTYDALWEGRKFVELIQKIMSNSADFIRIEAWYRSNEESAVNARDNIASAIKSAWYEKFKDFSATIIEFINSMPTLSKEAENSLREFSDYTEISADEVAGI